MPVFKKLFVEFCTLIFYRNQIIIVKVLRKKIRYHGVVQKSHDWGLFKNVQMQGAQKAELLGVYFHTLSGAVCSATPQMSVFQQPHYSDILFFSSLNLLSASRGDID